MKKTIFTFAFFFLCVILNAQNGAPLLTHFRENRDIENQNWAICQDSNKIMLFANRKGLLSFDGEDWTPIRLKITPYAMRMNPFDKHIYIAGENNYGLLQRDSKGSYIYESLSGDSADLGMITRIIFNDSTVVFFGDHSVSWHNLKTHTLQRRIVASIDFPFTGTFLKGGMTFVNVAGKGLHRIEADTLFPIVTGYLTENTDVLFSLPYDDNRIVLGFSNGRLSLFDGIKYYTYPIKDDGYLSANVLADAISVGDSLYAFSTLGGGALVSEKKSGKVRYIINNQKGLPDDEVFAIGSDMAGGLWLSHPFGLSRADLKLPVGNFSVYPGLKGNLSTSLKYNNELYAATSEGVFYLSYEKSYTEIEILRKNEAGTSPATMNAEPVKEITAPLAPPAKQENTRKGIFNRIFGKKTTGEQKTSSSVSSMSGSSHGTVAIKDVPAASFRTEKIKQLKSIDYIFRKIDGISEKCRQLVPTDNGILAATNRGLYVIKNHQAVAIAPDRYINYITWNSDAGKYAVAASDGYFIAGFANGKWSVTVPDRTFKEPLYSIVRTYANTYWMAGDNKAWRTEESAGKVSYKSFTIDNAFSQRYLVDLINDTIFLFTETSVNIFDKTSDKFVQYKGLKLPETSEFKYPVSNIPLIVSGTSWIYPEVSDRIKNKDLCMLKLFDDVISVYYNDGKIWIVDGMNNLFGIDCNKASSIAPETGLLVKHIRNEKGTVFDLSDVVFERGDNVINFDIVVPAYLNKKLTEYQYYIDGVMSEWSPWSNRTSYSRGIPKPGNYELQIRARDLWGQVGEPVSLKFTMKAPFTQTSVFYLLTILGSLLIILVIIRFREGQLHEKNRILEEKVKERTAEIEAQKEEITSSIEYASRIQMAMLPIPALFNESFSEYFIIFKPRDIVSGDFYWVGEDSKNIYFTVADCTGHGVPGAFMSALGISILNEIITHNKDLKASNFLNLLREQVKTQLHQTGKEGEAADGMDISLCVLKKNRELLQFSGAFNPLYAYTGGELIEFKADRMPIGIHYGDEASFTNHEIKVKKGDVLYLLSDGLTDQFGGPEGSKFKKAQFKKLISEIHHRPLSDQKKLIELEFLKWKGNHEQIDDVTVMGIRI
ncbi:MAG TPA: SpoIIE family protein phosphatase [Bacteroidales bacterium]|nr:SpoIIE family protein phosphatase [Bacteroidales bacterium]